MVQCGAGKVSQMIDNDCWCHLMIDDAVAETSTYGTSVKVKFSVLACTDSSQVGKSLTEFFQVDGGAVDKLYNIAEAVGLITHEQRKAAAERNVGMDIDETRMKGRQLCAEIKMEQNMRKNVATGNYEVDPEKPGPFPRIGFRSFGVFSPKAKDIPKDQQFVRMLQQSAAAGQGQVPQQPMAPQQPQQHVQQPAAADTSMNW